MIRLAILRWVIRTIGGGEEEQDEEPLSNNVEGNEEKISLAGSGLHSLTPPWQHDNPIIRVPTKTLKDQWVAVMVMILQILALRRARKEQADRFLAHMALTVTGVSVSLPTDLKHLTPPKVTGKNEARALVFLNYLAGPGALIITGSGFGLAIQL